MVKAHLRDSLDNVVEVVSDLPHISALIISQNSLYGTIPKSISVLKSLAVLDIQENDLLEGTIPEEMMYLTKLKSLPLERIPLTGTLPVEISRLKHLERFSLKETSVRGPLPPSIFHELTRLTDLRVHISVNGYGSISPGISNLSRLTMFDLQLLGGLGLIGTLPETISTLTRLREFSLVCSNVAGSLSAFQSLTGLQILNVTNNRFTGQLNNLAHLKQLELST